MSWAQGFKLGSEMARNWIDTYESSKRGLELENIRRARPEESMGYTAEQGRELEAIAGAINPETGQPYYQVEAIPGTAQFRVTPNFQVAGDQGQMQQAMPVEMAPQRVTDYLGQRTAGTLSPEQQERAQYRAMADVLAQANPMEAARLRMSITQDERSAKEFEQSTELRGLQIGSAQRQATINSKIDAVVEEEEKNIAATRDIFTTRGLEGGAAELKKRGLPVRFNNGAIEVLDEKGKVVERITDIDQAISRTEEVIQADMADRLARISGDPAVIRQAVKDRFDRQMRTREQNIKEQLLPEQIAQMRASTENSLAAARKANMESDRLAEMQKLNKELNELLKDPKKNAQAILALATRMETMFPEVYTKQGKITRDGEEVLTTVGLLTTSAGRALEAGGVVRLPAQVRGIVQQAAERAKGDRAKFAKDPTIQNILRAQPQIKISDLEEVAFGPATQAEALPGAATTGSQLPAPRAGQAIPTRTRTGETVGILTPESRLVSDLQAGDPASISYVDSVLATTYGGQRLSNVVLEAAARGGSRAAAQELQARSQRY